MNGYNDITTEPADDEEFALAYGYEIITENELLGMLSSYNGRSSSHRPSFILPSNTMKERRGSFASASSGVSSLMMSKPMSSCSLSSQATDMSDEDCSSSTSSGFPESHHDDDTHEGNVDIHQLSVENLWYVIQQKRHLHEMEEEEEMRMAHLLAMEHSSNGKKLTAWFSNLIHLPEKLKQISADKHRFNINKLPTAIRDELKHIYVY